MMHSMLFACALALLLPSPLESQSTVDADTKELQAYKLTLPALKQFAAATRNLVAAAKADPRYIQLMKLQSELERLQQKDELTEAEEARIEKLSEELEALEDKMPTSFNIAEHKTLADMEAAIRKEPLIANALQSADMAPRDYAKFGLAFFQAAMIHGMQKSGLIKEIPKDLQATVNMENIEFIEAHQGEINALMAELQRLGQQQ